MRIAVTGCGIISAIGTDKASVLKSLLNGETGIGQMRYLRSERTDLPVGEVKLTNEELKARAGIAESETISRTALLGMIATGEALEEAGLAAAGSNGGLRVAFISGTTVAGMDITEQHFAEATDGGCGDCAFIRQHECGSDTTAIAGHFGLLGESATISTACSSAANAILLGARMLKAGDADIVVAGGTEALSRFHLNGFNSLMILDHERCRPFDKARTGLNLGEGAAYIVMESAESAQRRGRQPMAYVTGYGNACDAFHQTASSADGEGAYLAMKEALAMAGLRPDDVQYVNAHGTGTASNDKSESQALRRIFGNKMPAVSSTKSATGHTTSASGSIETVICILAMRNKFIPANLGWEERDEECVCPTPTVVKSDIDNVMCNSFGFGGNDTSIVLSAEAKDTEEWHPLFSVRVASVVEIDNDASLGEIKKYVSPMEARRMGKLAKSAMLSSLKALEKAGIEKPDAIVTATRFGCLANTERILTQMKENGEGSVSPTDFMQSTHNTIGSGIAIKLKCHGYNVTYSHGRDSLREAINDAELLISSGKCNTVLVGCHDEISPAFADIMKRSGEEFASPLRSVAIVLTRREPA